MYKVFFNNNSLILSNNKLIGVNLDLTHIYNSEHELRTFIFKDCLKLENKTILIYNSDIDILWLKFKQLFKVKVAGGGVVVNKDKEILFIKRRGLWDLPKGHKEEDEDIEKTAIREVSEECGIENLSIIRPLQTSYHTYWLNDKPILKPTFWFLMAYSEEKKGTPQLEEEITEIKWFNKTEINIALSHTFPSIRDTINDYFSSPDV